MYISLPSFRYPPVDLYVSPILFMYRIRMRVPHLCFFQSTIPTYTPFYLHVEIS